MKRSDNNLTERTIKALEPADADRFIWDPPLAGFGVRVKPSGAKSFVLWYRTRAGTKRLYTIGPTAAYRLEQARDEAREWLVKIKKGADPVAERHAARKTKTISELADRYLAEHVKAHNKPSTAAEIERIVENRIKPELGRIIVTELTRARIKQWHQGKSTTPYGANRCLACLSKMMSLAATEWELRPDNPCKGIKKFPEKKRERFLSADELKRLGEALAQAARAQLEAPSVITAIRLLALTGCRLGEILGLTWDRVDLEGGALWLADAKAGARAVPLGAPAIALLSQLPREGSPWVVPGRDADEPLSTAVMEKGWRRICKRAGLEDARLHDLRHTLGTYAGQAGLNAFMVRDLLGHKTLTMAGRYVERDIDPLRAAADHVSEHIAAAMAGNIGQVVPLAKSRAK